MKFFFYAIWESIINKFHTGTKHIHNKPVSHTLTIAVLWHTRYNMILCSQPSLIPIPGNENGPGDKATSFSLSMLPGVDYISRFEKIMELAQTWHTVIYRESLLVSQLTMLLWRVTWIWRPGRWPAYHRDTGKWWCNRRQCQLQCHVTIGNACSKCNV